MNKRDFEKLAKELLPLLPSYGYVKSRHVLYQSPIGNILRGFLFESSGFSANAFYPQVFVQPLCVPVEYLTLDFGKRFRGHWEYENGGEELLANSLFRAMENERAFRLIQDLSTAEMITQNLGKYSSNPKNPHFQQAIAYSYAVAAQYEEAIHWLDKCCDTLQQMKERDPIINWPTALLKEVNQLKDAVHTSPKAAKELLDEWTEFTRAKLGLPE